MKCNLWSPVLFQRYCKRDWTGFVTTKHPDKPSDGFDKASITTTPPHFTTDTDNIGDKCHIGKCRYIDIGISQILKSSNFTCVSVGQFLKPESVSVYISALSIWIGLYIGILQIFPFPKYRQIQIYWYNTDILLV